MNSLMQWVHESREELSRLRQDMNARLHACFERSRPNTQVEAPISIDLTEDSSTHTNDKAKLEEAPSPEPTTLLDVDNEAEVEAIDALIDAPINELVVDDLIDTLISELVVDDLIDPPIS